MYEEMRVLKCTCPPDDDEEDLECKGCEAWADLNRKLLHLLGSAIPVHEYAVVPPPCGMAVEPERAVERMAAFEAALATRGANRSSKPDCV
jgi:protein-disulfide isomerase